jgi:hypothetical protein
MRVAYAPGLAGRLTDMSEKSAKPRAKRASGFRPVLDIQVMSMPPGFSKGLDLLRRAFKLLQGSIRDRRGGAALRLAELDGLLQTADRFLDVGIGLLVLRGPGVLQGVRRMQNKRAWLALAARGDGLPRMSNGFREMALHRHCWRSRENMRKPET